MTPDDPTAVAQCFVLLLTIFYIVEKAFKPEEEEYPPNAD